MANTNLREIIGTESQDESHVIDRLLLKSNNNNSKNSIKSIFVGIIQMFIQPHVQNVRISERNLNHQHQLN